ncbi:hypothetical protein pqer_cds_978 [Pandoravirus quercus]|uniref:Uncharacterized protein n=2 Tax=Pandoravirus TaxID=2060084 RepID=A0A2U7UAJ1_9VIRU|nr:hypothetical protein pqer_cds_978 [Pandoravirus quercus]AVK75400.1 hypothetical protein pqer_cds_978 [Pandoravirus quercus]QBZ81578.1 hypothetical protein pclt_cds_992 [Pandoravirus celtis]
MDPAAPSSDPATMAATTCWLTIVERVEDNDDRLAQVNTGFIINLDGSDLNHTAERIYNAIVEVEAHRSHYLARRPRVPETIVIVAGGTDMASSTGAISANDLAWLIRADAARSSAIGRLFCIVHWKHEDLA